MTQNPWGPGSDEPQQGGWGQQPAPYGQPSASAPYGQPSASAPYGQPSASAAYGYGQQPDRPYGQPSGSAYSGYNGAHAPAPTRFPQPSQSVWQRQDSYAGSYGQQPGYAGQHWQQGYNASGQPGYTGQPGYMGQPGYSGQQADFQAPPPTYSAPPGSRFGPPQTAPVYPAQAPWGYSPQPPPKRHSGWLGILVTLLAFAVLASAVVAVFNTMNHPRGNPTGTTSASATASPTSHYANDGYQVPEPDPKPGALPRARTEEEMKEWMESNPLYNEAVPTPIRCEVADLDLTTATNDELQKHINDEVACLMRSWSLPVQQAGFTLYRPTVTVYENSVSTGCGTIKDKNAVYCGGDQQIYYARNVYLGMPQEMQGKRWTVEAIVAHEFGHAIQGRTGILTALHDYQSTATGKPIRNELNRRLETQADCFGGVFLGQVSESMKMTPDEVKLIKHMFFDFGDDQQSGDNHIDGDHGFGTNREYWMDQGLNAKTYAACNTFTAPSGQVR